MFDAANQTARRSEARKSMRDSYRNSFKEGQTRTFSLKMDDNVMENDLLDASEIRRRTGTRGSLKGSFSGPLESNMALGNQVSEKLLLN